MIIFANSLDPDQARQNVGPDLDPNCLTPWLYSWKNYLKNLRQTRGPSGPKALTWVLFKAYILVQGLNFSSHTRKMRVKRGLVCGQNICYHVAASVVSFNLICNMTIFWKSLILTTAPPPKSTQQAQTQAFKLKFHLICFISIAALPVCKNFSKKYWQLP